MKRMIMVFLLVALVAGMAVPSAAFAQEGDAQDQKVVRVGWFESSFCSYDKFGRCGGIDYEYQQKISAYTGWEYEYVEDSWPNLLQMLMDGEIDLLSDVSYTKERTESMLFPDLPMGTEAYYIYIDAENREITEDNLKSFNGKRTGRVSEDQKILAGAVGISVEDIICAEAVFQKAMADGGGRVLDFQDL